MVQPATSLWAIPSKQPRGCYVNVVTYGCTGMIFEATTNAGPGTFTQIQPSVDEIV